MATTDMCFLLTQGTTVVRLGPVLARRPECNRTIYILSFQMDFMLQINNNMIQISKSSSLICHFMKCIYFLGIGIRTDYRYANREIYLIYKCVTVCLYRGNSSVFHYSYIFCTLYDGERTILKSRLYSTQMNFRIWLWKLKKTWLPFILLYCFFEMARYQEHASPRLFDFSQLYHSC
jgi:hypothetical protein